MRADIYQFVNTHGTCQQIVFPKTVTYVIVLPTYESLRGILSAFASLFPITNRNNCLLLVFVEHQTEWPVVRATNMTAADDIVSFLMEEPFLPFGAPKIILSDNSACFTAQAVQRHKKRHGKTWSTVAAYSPMSSESAERMVGAMKKTIGRVVNKSRQRRDAVNSVLLGYLFRPGCNRRSSYELLYDARPWIVPSELANLAQGGTGEDRCTELLTRLGPRLAQVKDRKKQDERESNGKRFAVECLVMIAYK